MLREPQGVHGLPRHLRVGVVRAPAWRRRPPSRRPAGPAGPSPCRTGWAGSAPSSAPAPMNSIPGCPSTEWSDHVSLPTSVGCSSKKVCAQPLHGQPAVGLQVTARPASPTPGRAASSRTSCAGRRSAGAPWRRPRRTRSSTPVQRHRVRVHHVRVVRQHQRGRADDGPSGWSAPADRPAPSRRTPGLGARRGPRAAGRAAVPAAESLQISSPRRSMATDEARRARPTTTRDRPDYRTAPADERAAGGMRTEPVRPGGGGHRRAYVGRVARSRSRTVAGDDLPRPGRCSWPPTSPGRPANGDRFYIPRPEIADSVFLVSDMVVELVTQKGESRFHFNGTVEWALDSVESNGVVWLPREDQLRELLGRLLPVPGLLGRRVRGHGQRTRAGPTTPNRSPTRPTRTPGRCSVRPRGRPSRLSRPPAMPQAR